MIKDALDTSFKTLNSPSDARVNTLKWTVLLVLFGVHTFNMIRGGSICNENPFITPSPNALGFYVICQTKDQGIAFIMVQKKLFYLSKFNKLQAFLKSTLIYTAYIFLRIVKTHFNKGRKACYIF